jgi:hypothetical protein
MWDLALVKAVDQLVVRDPHGQDPSARPPRAAVFETGPNGASSEASLESASIKS